jgi:uncharacterized protein YfaP (DUF2135 family)
MDLHVTEPNGTEIAFYAPGPTATGGNLDFDSNVGCIDGPELENILWPDGSTPAAGLYHVFIDTFTDCQGDANWTVTIRVNGVVRAVVTGSGQQQFDATVNPDGTVSTSAVMPAAALPIEAGGAVSLPAK